MQIFDSRTPFLISSTASEFLNVRFIQLMRYFEWQQFICGIPLGWVAWTIYSTADASSQLSNI